MKHLFVISLLLFGISCSPSHQQESTEAESTTKDSIRQYDLQGHRGCRGLMPENSLPAFLHALDLGVNTLELDVVITKDSQVILSHEPFLSHLICSGPEGEEITEENETEYNLFDMTFEEIVACDCGSKPHPNFPEQKKLVVRKPLLKTVIDEVEAYVKENDLAPIHYNIETKYTDEGLNIYHPDAATFSRLLLEVIKEKGVADRVVIQSFAVETLQEVKKQKPDMGLVLLVANEMTAQENLDTLGFTPEIYSPYYKLINEDLMRFAKEKGMKVIPWTVNEVADMEAMLELGVDGIITDYPDRAL